MAWAPLTWSCPNFLELPGVRLKSLWRAGFEIGNRRNVLPDPSRYGIDSRTGPEYVLRVNISEKFEQADYPISRG